MNKIRIGNSMSLKNTYQQTIRIMKLTLIALFIFTTSLFANVRSQTTRVNIQVQDVATRTILDDIEKQTDYLFIYNADEVDLARKTSLHASNNTVAEVLSHLFNGTDVVYAMEGSNIMLMKKDKGLDSLPQSLRRISGVVTDPSGIPIIGANVVIKGTTQGTVTDLDGRYQLEVPEGAVLQISYIGYFTQEVKVGNRPVVSVSLAENTKQLDEIVVIGYGTQKKGEVASAIASIKSDHFIQGTPVADAAQLIRGKVAGLTIVSPDANPTSTSQIALRGITTLKSSTSPLVLIDGIPGSLNTVSPDDIEQIDVLKDGSAAAIYGTRGTNGVILITTKSAKGEMPTTIEVNAYVSTQQITKKLPFLSTGQYRELAKQGKPGAQDNGSATDWLDEILRTPLTQVYNISLRGGSKNTNYVASLEYRGIDGIIKRTDNTYIYPRMEINHRMFDDKLKMTASLSGYKQSNFAGYTNDIYRNALIYNPTTPAKDAEGKWSESPSTSSYANPLALLYETQGKDESTNLRAFATITLSLIKGLDIKYLASSDTYNQTKGYYETHKHISTITNDRNGYARRGTIRRSETISELTAQYNTTVNNDHSFTVLAGYSWLKNNFQDYSMENYNFPSDDYTYNNMELGQALTAGRAVQKSLQKENKLIGYFGRFNYNYQGKYILSASVRYEGSSKFGADHKWGTFPAVSGAWNMKGEGFLRENEWLSNLKLRAGFGVTGTEPNDPYMSLNVLNFSDYVYYNQQWKRIAKQNSNPNPDLRWEKKKEMNVGIDFGFFKDRLYGSIDYYNRKTTDLLWDYKVPTPPYLYPDMIGNAGSMRNQGVEISVTAIPLQTKDFQWTTSANYSTNKNKLLSLSNDKFVSTGYADQGSTGEPMQQATHRIQEGMPIGNFYGFKSIDIDDNGYWIIEGKDGKPKSINDQQPDDKQILGNGLPKHYLNWNNTLTYKNFDFSVTMRGAFGFQILNMPALQYNSPVMLGRGNILATAYDKVYGKRSLADDQALQYVSYYIENGNYWKIDNLTLGYTLDLHTSWIQRLRIYGSVSNLATLTAYSGIDPEVNITGLNPGCDEKNRYPSARTFTLGLSLKF